MIENDVKNRNEIAGFSHNFFNVVEKSSKYSQTIDQSSLFTLEDNEVLRLRKEALLLKRDYYLKKIAFLDKILAIRKNDF